MKFTLKDYQDESALDVLGNLTKARKRWRGDGDGLAVKLLDLVGHEDAAVQIRNLAEERSRLVGAIFLSLGETLEE